MFQSFLSVVSGFIIHLNKRYQYFLQNERFVYIFDGEKLCPYLEKIKFVCKLMHFEHYKAENVVTEGTLKQMSFTCIKMTKGFVIVVFVERKDTIIVDDHI